MSKIGNSISNGRGNRFLLFILFILFSIPLILFFLFQAPAPSPSFTWQSINGRDEGSPIDRAAVYQAKVPLHWIRKDPLNADSIQDTTKALCEFIIEQGTEHIRITVHNFPIVDEKARIPAQAQIQRWKQQLNDLDSTLTVATPISHGGFIGLFLEAEGSIEDKPVRVLGWSMQLASRYVRQFALASAPLERQKRSDYTIKAVGPPPLMQQHRQDIIQFADSFELKDELPWSP